MSLLATVATVAALGATLGGGLMMLARVAGNRDDSLTEQVNDLLPQTQCAQCGYPGCRPYAEAIVAGSAAIDQCPPGGDDTVRRLAELLGAEATGVNPEFGVTTPGILAWINEEHCIGCALCLPACPVDAIVGAHRYTHTVLASVCTGCELCLPPCPVDCIELRSS